jgi:REP element-mobilizing transposase RayT
MMWIDSPDSDSGKTLAEAYQKTGWQVHAYCLMRNHFHLVMETPNANVEAVDMKPQCKTFAQGVVEFVGSTPSANQARQDLGQCVNLEASWNREIRETREKSRAS